MQVTVANSKVRVVVMEVTKRLSAQTFKGAMLIGIAFFASGFFTSGFLAKDTEPPLTDSVGATPCVALGAANVWVPFADAQAGFAASAKTNHSKKKVKIWKFVQRSTHGHSILLFNESAIKYIFADQHVSWTSAAPSWNVCIFNSKVNRGTLRTSDYCIVRQDNKFDYGRATVISRTKILFQNRPAIKVLYKVNSSDPLKEKVEMMYQTGSQRADSFTHVEQIFSDWIKISPQVQNVLNGLTKTAKVSGVMLEEIHVYPSGRRHKVLSTESYTQCDVPASEFDYPTGFKDSTIKNIMEESEKARDMTGVFEELLFDPAPTKGKSPKGK